MPAPTRPGVTSYATSTDTAVVITRVVDAPRQLVFDMWTKPEHVPQWLTGPEGWSMPVCEIDLRAGGKWHFVWRKSNGEETGMTGAYREVSRRSGSCTPSRGGPTGRRR